MSVSIGVDNGVTGSIGIITPGRVFYSKMPTFSALNYQKTVAKNITRISSIGLEQIITSVIGDELGVVSALIERPFTSSNPKFFQTVMSNARALEVVLVTFERMRIGYNYCDSTEWQRELIPGYKIRTQNALLKKRSLDIGKRMYPQINWNDFDDADGLLIATYLMRRWETIE